MAATISQYTSPESFTTSIEFFITFSRFEYALKASGFSGNPKGYLNANWDGFTNNILDKFIKKLSEDGKLNTLVDDFLDPENAPNTQILKNEKIVWSPTHVETKPTDTEEAIKMKKLLIYIKTIRNNLFHGGKYPLDLLNNHRNMTLMKNAIIILKEWVKLNDKVYEIYYDFASTH